jgi:hypothetical protein
MAVMAVGLEVVMAVRGGDGSGLGGTPPTGKHCAKERQHSNEHGSHRSGFRCGATYLQLSRTVGYTNILSRIWPKPAFQPSMCAQLRSFLFQFVGKCLFVLE